MNRRDFLRRAAIVAGGVVAADLLDLLERLAHRTVFTTGGYSARLHAEHLQVVYEEWPLGMADVVVYPEWRHVVGVPCRRCRSRELLAVPS